MMTLVLGSSSSGKSALAEALCLESGDKKRYYLATMQVLDREGRERVQRHRSMREGKGFVTLERPRSVDEALREIADPLHATVLLECVANLVGNERHAAPGEGPLPGSWAEAEEERFADRVAAQVERLSAGVHHLIAVSDDYPAEDPAYDEDTRQYVRLLQLVNLRLERMADRVLDVRRLTS